MGADVVEECSVEFVDVVAETDGWCVKDLVRRGWVVALGRHECCVAEFFDALDLCFEFAAPFRSRVEEDLPTSLCVSPLSESLPRTLSRDGQSGGELSVLFFYKTKKDKTSLRRLTAVQRVVITGST